MAVNPEKLPQIEAELDEVNAALNHLVTAQRMHAEVCPDEEGSCAIARRILFLVDQAVGLRHTYEAAVRQ